MKNQWLMVLLERIELSTSPLPRECSTSELQQPIHFQGITTYALLIPYLFSPRPANSLFKHTNLEWTYPLPRVRSTTELQQHVVAR